MRSCHRLLFLFLLLSTAGLGFAGCYTQLAGSGDYWGYTGRAATQPQRTESDTTVIIERKTTVAPQSATVTPQNATAKNDTIYIDDDRLRTDYRYPETVVNNYYGYSAPYDPYDHWWYGRHHSGFSINISYGDPYWCSPWPSSYAYYEPWYYPSWYYPYDYFYHGYRHGPGRYAFEPYYPYPPSPWYGCYAPVYSPDPYWYQGLGGGYGYWDDPYYGAGYYGGYYGGGGGTSGGSRGRVGRIGGGEQRAGGSTNSNTSGRASSIVPVSEGGMVGVPVTTGDRNTPVHVVPPTMEGTTIPGDVTASSVNGEAVKAPVSIGTIERNDARTAPTATVPTGTSATVTGSDANSAAVAPAPHSGRTVIIRRHAPSASNTNPTGVSDGSGAVRSNDASGSSIGASSSGSPSTGNATGNGTGGRKRSGSRAGDVSAPSSPRTQDAVAPNGQETAPRETPRDTPRESPRAPESSGRAPRESRIDGSERSEGRSYNSGSYNSGGSYSGGSYSGSSSGGSYSGGSEGRSSGESHSSGRAR